MTATKPDTKLFKFEFNKKIYTSFAVSEEKAKCNIVYVLSRKYELPYKKVYEMVVCLDEFYAKRGEYRQLKKDRNKMKNFYKELMLEDMKRHEREISTQDM